MTKTIRAPWTSEQVDALNQFQQTGGMHPFTCGGDHPGAARVLDATHSGWICPAPDCGYEQDWAHAFMADPSCWPKFPFGERHGPTPGEIRRMTEPTPAHGGMIDGQPSMPILIGEYHALVAQVAEATALENRLRLAHQARRAKEHQLDDIRRALCDIGVIQDDDPYSHADLADVIRQLGRLDGPGPAANQATEGVCSDPAPETEPNNRWLLANSRDLSIPQQLPKFTAVHVTPEMERAATERTRQMAEAHEQAVQSLVLAFGGQAGDHPSRRAELRDLVAAAIWERQNPGRSYADCEHPWQADAEEDANAVLALLYREWPWLRAEAEDATPSRADIVRILTTTRSRAGQQAPGLEFPDHHQPGETGHVGWCALCARDVDALADALLAAFVNSTVRASGQ